MVRLRPQVLQWQCVRQQPELLPVLLPPLSVSAQPVLSLTEQPLCGAFLCSLLKHRAEPTDKRLSNRFNNEPALKHGSAGLKETFHWSSKSFPNLLFFWHDYAAGRKLDNSRLFLGYSLIWDVVSDFKSAGQRKRTSFRQSFCSSP